MRLLVFFELENAPLNFHRGKEILRETGSLLAVAHHF